MAITKDILIKYKLDMDVETDVAEVIYQQVLESYMSKLDDVVIDIEKILKEIENEDIEKFSNEELEKICIKIPMLMYQIGGELERVGVKIDVSNAIKSYKHSDNLLRSTGTVIEKKAKADLSIQNEDVVEIIYKRVYKQIDRKLTYIDSLYNSIKKVMSLRIKELEVFRRD